MKISSLTPESKLVSIIIPVYNKLAFTKKCLDSIFRNTQKVDHEIIVVNNASSDGTKEYLDSLTTVRSIHNDENLGFVEACNKGAFLSEAKYIFFLNNDTEVCENWLQPLISMMEEYGNYGAVGSKLIFPEGKLQEAGAIIFNDGNGWNFGYGDNPLKDEYNYSYEVDYCSGAALIVRNELFKTLKGFDKYFAPAYYEDSDLCFRIRQLGYKIIYNPHSVVIHHESVTAGKDNNSGFKKYLGINRQKFTDRWSEELKYHSTHPHVSGIKPKTANRNLIHNIFRSFEDYKLPDKKRKKAVLFFPQNPHPAMTGAHRRFLSMMDSLHSLGYEIVFMSTTMFGNYIWNDLSIKYFVKNYNATVIVYSGNSDDFKYMAEAELKNIEPVNWDQYTPPGLVSSFQSLVKRIQPDITMVNYAYWARLINDKSIDYGCKIVDTHDLVTLNSRMRKNLLEILGRPPYRKNKIATEILDKDFFDKMNLQPDEEEFICYDQFDIAFSISENEATIISEKTSNVKVISAPMTFHSMELKNDYSSNPVFVIGDNPFNIQGYYYFVTNILPHIVKRIPNFELNVLGDACIQIDVHKNIKRLGRVEDLSSIYSKTKFAICPLIGQTGMSVKIVEAMVHGVPVVALKNAAIGSPIVHGVNAFIANDEIEFADYVIKLFLNKGLCKQLGKAAIQTINNHYSSSNLNENVLKALKLSNEIGSEIKYNSNLSFWNNWGISEISTSTQKIAIGLVEHFGDIVACEPVVRYIKSNYPEVYIVWVTKENYRELVETNPWIDEVVTVDSLSDWIEIKKQNEYAKYIDLHVNNRVCVKTGTTLFKTEGVTEINTESYYFYGPILTSFALSAGLPPLNAQPKVYIPAKAINRVDELYLPKNSIVFHCSSNEISRDWKTEKWVALAEWLIEEWNLTIIEIGSFPVLASRLSHYDDKYRNYCGKLSLLETSEVIRRSELFIGIDSGPAHLANAVGTFGIILLGEYRLFKKYLPYSGSYGNGEKAELIYNTNGPAADIALERIFEVVEKKLLEKNYKKFVKHNSIEEKDLPAVARLIAFYLPQFHPIPENDLWWGKGFTEWTNVSKAKPLFDGHYQPHQPADLGYYDLRLSETRKAQADLAKKYGIEGFCYWHYWFNGKRLIERPFNEVLETGEPDFPFCLAWANENWTRRWDGFDSEILQSQDYGGADDDKAHFEWLSKAFIDKRYIRVNNKPMFLVYNPAKLPHPEETISLWRKLARQHGFEGIYLLAIKSFAESRKINWQKKGFDAELYFQPDWNKIEKAGIISNNQSIIDSSINSKPQNAFIADYEDVWSFSASDFLDESEAYTCVVPMWDNTARKKNGGVVLHNSKPQMYKEWLSFEIQRIQNRPREKRIVFVNAWNEWAEGNHLEPDQKYGLNYLYATKDALTNEMTDSERVNMLSKVAMGYLRLGNNEKYDQIISLLLKDKDNQIARQMLDDFLLMYQSRLLNEKGVVSYNIGERTTSINCFFSAIQTNQHNIIAKKNYAKLCLEMGNATETIKYCTQIIFDEPLDKEAYSLLGEAYFSIGDTQNASKFLKKIEPNSRFVHSLLAKLEREKSSSNIIYKPELNGVENTKSNLDGSSKSSAGPKKIVSIIIITYNNLEYTQQCVESIGECNSSTYELIFVDNASSDLTSKWVKEVVNNNPANCKAIFNEHNLGFPVAVNQALLISRGDFILILNNDTIVTDGWLERLVEVAESENKIGLVGPISNIVSGLQLDKEANYKSIEEMPAYAETIRRKNEGEIFPFPRIAFLCTLIKKEVIEKIGGLDERFSPGNYEDDDFCLRAQLAGYKTVIAQDVFIHHYGSKSFKANGEKAYAERLEVNKLKFVNKWGVTPDELWLQNKTITPKQIMFPINKNKFIQFFDRSRIQMADKEYPQALESLKSTIENYSATDGEKLGVSFEDLLDLAGNVSLAIDEHDLAKYYFEQELNLNPNSSSACVGLGEIFFIQEDFENAKTMFEWAVKNSERNDVAKNSLAKVNSVLGIEPFHNSLYQEE